MVKFGVLFEVWPEFLNIIYRSFGFKGFTNFEVESVKYILSTICWVFKKRNFLNLNICYQNKNLKE
jgi:hypothetical protein